MRIRQTLPLIVLISLFATGYSARSQTSAQTTVRLLKNADVLQMVTDGMKADEIIAKIRTSPCNFDIFPPVLRDLRRRGVPDVVLMVMSLAPSGPPDMPPIDVNRVSLTAPARIPAGTSIEVETAKAVSSRTVSVGTPVSFLVTKRIFVNKVLIVERGALAQGRITSVKRAAAFGRAGMLAWALEYVVAVDGTRIPIQVVGRQSGTNRSAAIAGGAAATAAVLFPYTSPVALIWGLKKGDEAVLRGSRRFNATVEKETEILGFQPRPGGAIYHDMDTVKASAAPPTNTNFDRSGFKPKTSIRSN